MGWIQRLCQTYDNCSMLVGSEPLVNLDENNTKTINGVLLPIAHTLLKAHITMTLDAEGNFLDAQVLEDVTGTIAPCTEDSDSRSKGSSPHPLFDKLQYLAGDYSQFTGKNKVSFHEKYLQQLGRWCRSPYGHPLVQAVYKYVLRGTLVTDLINKHVLFVNDKGYLLDKWNGLKADAPPFYKLANCSYENVVVRFEVLRPNETETRLWMNTDVRQTFLAYTAWIHTEKRLCYVTGEVVPFIEKHPKKTLRTSTHAKLISTNDSKGFTYRGRFIDASQTVSIGFEASYKAHNALRWLIDTRGTYVGSKVILAWDTGNEPIPAPTMDSQSLFGSDEVTAAYTRLLQAYYQSQQTCARLYTRAMLSKHTNLNDNGDTIVMALDSATLGRLSITFYQEMRTKDYLDRLVAWHNTCAWHHFGYRDNKAYAYINAPSFEDITLAAYGSKCSEMLRKETFERLLPCVLDGAPLPRDIVRNAINRASSPIAMDRWEWKRILNVACALYRKQNGCPLFLDEQCTDRSYLYGRLLAVADQAEWLALNEASELGRGTNAMRHMRLFSQRPIRGWKIICNNLYPYLARLENRTLPLSRMVAPIIDHFKPGEFDTQLEVPLTGAYLLGFYSQRQALIDSRILSSRINIYSDEGW